MSNVLKSLPSVGELLESPPLKSLADRVNRHRVVSQIRRVLDDLRGQVQTAAVGMHVPTASELAQRIADWISVETHPGPHPVINATGIVLHPWLGRVPLAEEAVEAAAAVSRNYASVDWDKASGGRTEHDSAVVTLLTELTGAEDAHVVNNGAAATLVALAALAAGREVIVARNQLIDLLDGYSVADSVVASGALLREVGAANRIRLDDYAAAIGPQTAALLHIECANLAVPGTSEALLGELVGLARRNSLPVIHWSGSAALRDLSAWDVRGAELAADLVRTGADLILFSGDKLIGGPPCGVLVGRQSLLARIRKHPLARALRVDKLRLAALAATLRLYSDSEAAERSIPLLSLLAAPLANLQHRAERLAPQLAAAGAAAVEIVRGTTPDGPGYAPLAGLPTVCLAITPQARSAEDLAAALRSGDPAVVCRTDAGRVLFDLRSVLPREDARLVAAVEAQRSQPDEPSPPASGLA